MSDAPPEPGSKEIRSLTEQLLHAFEELDLLHGVCEILSTSADPDEANKHILREAMATLEADLGWVVYDDGQRRTAGLAPERRRAHGDVPERGGGRRGDRTGQHVWTDDLAHEDGAEPQAAESVPLRPAQDRQRDAGRHLPRQIRHRRGIHGWRPQARADPLRAGRQRPAAPAHPARRRVETLRVAADRRQHPARRRRAAHQQARRADDVPGRSQRVHRGRRGNGARGARRHPERIPVGDDRHRVRARRDPGQVRAGIDLRLLRRSGRAGGPRAPRRAHGRADAAQVRGAVVAVAHRDVETARPRHRHQYRLRHRRPHRIVEPEGLHRDWQERGGRGDAGRHRRPRADSHRPADVQQGARQRRGRVRLHPRHRHAADEDLQGRARRGGQAGFRRQRPLDRPAPGRPLDRPAPGRPLAISPSGAIDPRAVIGSGAISITAS